jgi:hypothetical protein
MASVTGYVTAEGVPADEYLRAAERGWWDTRPRRRSKASWRDRALFAAFIAPSLIAEIAPLVLFWNDHLPIWQMSMMMAAAWAVGWWVTWIIAMSLWTRRKAIGTI